LLIYHNIYYVYPYCTMHPLWSDRLSYDDVPPGYFSNKKAAVKIYIYFT
jgi:hypothetical protein